jgi:hypothetical protein
MRKDPIRAGRLHLKMPSNAVESITAKATIKAIDTRMTSSTTSMEHDL